MLRKMVAMIAFSLMTAAVAQAAQAPVAGAAATAPATAGEAQTAAAVSAARGAAGDVDQGVPAQVGSDHWAYAGVKELMDKHGVDRKLPEGRPCPKEELLDCFMATLKRVVQEYDAQGVQAVSRDDIDNIRSLVVALENDLFRIDGYREIRRTVEQLLVQVEPAGAPYYRYRLGVNGFLRGEGQSNFRIPEASYNPGHSEGRFVYRAKPYAYWHPNQYLDIHLEGQGYGFTGSNQDHHKMSLYQGYLEAMLPREDAVGKTWVALKAGRQEFNYGSSFIQGTDSFFNGLSFDALRLRLQPELPGLNFLTVDLLGGRYAKPSSDGVTGNLYGVYLTYEPAEGNALEAYAFRDTGSEEHHAGERLDSYGLRSTSSVGAFGLEYEAVYQAGRRFNQATGQNDDVSAYGGHIDLTSEFKVGAYDNSLLLGFALGSGDRNAANGGSANKEFRNPNNDNSLVGDMGLIGDFSGLDAGDSHASGLQIYTVGWGIDIPVGTTAERKVNLSATGRKFVAAKVPDGFSRNLGVETDFTVTYSMNKDLSLVVGYDHFFTGQFFRDATGSGRDIDYGYAMLVFNYDWTKRIHLKR